MKSTTDLALLLIRVGLGLVFMAHGWDSVSTMSGTVHFFASIGLAAAWAYVVAAVELCGGFLMLIGIGTGWTGVALAAIMMGAVVWVKISKGFLGGYEFELMLFLSAIAISLAGPGEYTARRIFGKK